MYLHPSSTFTSFNVHCQKLQLVVLVGNHTISMSTNTLQLHFLWNPHPSLLSSQVSSMIICNDTYSNNCHSGYVSVRENHIIGRKAQRMETYMPGRLWSVFYTSPFAIICVLTPARWRWFLPGMPYCIIPIEPQKETGTLHQIPLQAVTRMPIPPYGKYRGWNPRTQEVLDQFLGRSLLYLIMCLLLPGDGGS